MAVSDVDRRRAATFHRLQCVGGNLFWAAVLDQLGFQAGKIERYAAYKSLGRLILFSKHLVCRASAVAKNYELLHLERLARQSRIGNIAACFIERRLS